MPKVGKIPGEPAEQLSEGPNAEIEAKQVALKNLLDTPRSFLSSAWERSACRWL